MSRVSLSLRWATVRPSLVELTSTSSNRPRRSDSEPVPVAEASMLLKMRERVSLRFSSRGARSRTLSNRSPGAMKKPFSSMMPSRAPSASV